MVQSQTRRGVDCKAIFHADIPGPAAVDQTFELPSAFYGATAARDATLQVLVLLVLPALILLWGLALVTIATLD